VLQIYPPPLKVLHPYIPFLPPLLLKITEKSYSPWVKACQEQLEAAVMKTRPIESISDSSQSVKLHLT